MRPRGLRRYILERGGERVVPAIEKSDITDGGENLDDLTVVPVPLEVREMFVRDTVRYLGSRKGEAQGDALGVREQVAALEIPKALHLLVHDPAAQGIVGEMRLAVQAAGRPARDLRDAALQSQ